MLISSFLLVDSFSNDNETLPLEKMFDCLLQDIFSQRTARLSDDVDSRVSRALRASSRLWNHDMLPILVFFLDKQKT